MTDAKFVRCRALIFSGIVLAAWPVWAQTEAPDEDEDEVPVLDSIPYEAIAQAATTDRPSLRIRPRKLQLRRSVRGFGQFGIMRFASTDSFRAVTGSSSDVMLGGGGQVTFKNGLFVQGSYERFHTTGRRVLVFENQVFDLGIDNAITVIPIQLTSGYRYAFGRRTVGYMGGGLGWYRMSEKDEFSTPSENAIETASGYHVLGGVEYPMRQWLWLGGEAQWATTTGALGDGGVSSVFDETDLGGFTFRMKVSVSR